MSGARDPRGRLLTVAMLLLVMPGMVLAEARGRAAVIDGDTLNVSGTEVRLSGIDAPELDQRCSTSGDVLNENSDTYPCGMEAAAALADRIGDDPVICDEPASGSQKPVVAVCWLNDEDLGVWLVRSGWARAYPLSISPYTLAEKEAQAALRGIWRGDFLDPWDWRKQQAGRTGADRPKLMIAVGAANARSAPSRAGRLQGTLRRGEEVEQLGKVGQWYQVRLPGGSVGWILEDLVQPTPTRAQIDQ